MATFTRLQRLRGAELAVELPHNVHLRAKRSFDGQGHKQRMRPRRLRHGDSAADTPDYEFTSNGHVFSVFLYVSIHARRAARPPPERPWPGPAGGL